MVVANHPEWFAGRIERTVSVGCRSEVWPVNRRGHLNYINREWGLHYNRERPHEARGHLPPGMETPPETIDTVRPNDIVCKTRLGGLLTSYSRRAAWGTLYQIVRFARAVDTQIVEMSS